MIQPLFGQPETDVTVEEQQQSDDSQIQPQKLGGKKTWEKIVDFPGDLIYLPVKLTFKLLKESIAFVSESKVIPKTRDLLISDDERRGVLPTYTDRTGGGVKFFQRGWLSPESKLTLALTAGPSERQRYELRFKRLALFGGTFSSDLLARYQLLSSESFFGLGPDSEKSAKSNFAHAQTTGQASFGVGFGERLSLDAIFGVDVNDISEGRAKGDVPNTIDLFTEENLPGVEKKATIGRLQLGVTYDSKNRPGNPSKGTEATLTAGIFDDLDSDQFGFWKFSADFRQHIHLFYNRTLVLRVAAEITDPLSNREVPFYYLSELGPGESIRGFSRSRFRARDMVLGSLEYRYPIWMKGDALLFVDVGQVAEDIFNDLSIDNFAVGYGGGFRIWGKEGLVTSFVIGKSRDGFHVYFGLN